MKNKILVLIIMILIVSTNFITALYFLPSKNHPPIAFASANQTSGRAPLIIQFNGSAEDIENGKILYHWDFGDGATSNEKNPKHNYSTKGRFTVRLSVKDEKGNIGNDTLIINVIEYYQPIATASADIYYGKAPLSVQFYGLGIDIDGIITNYYWDFGDGEVSNEQNPTHEYIVNGQYSAYLTVKDDDGLIGTDSLKINAVSNCAPIAFGLADKTEGFFPLKIKFTGLGEDCDDTKLSYNWDFGAKTIMQSSTSTQQNPEFTYWLPGEYDVILKVTDDYGGEDAVTLKITVKNYIGSGSKEDGAGSSNAFQAFLFDLILKLVKSRDTSILKILYSLIQLGKSFTDIIPYLIDFIEWILEKFYTDNNIYSNIIDGNGIDIYEK